MDVQKLADTLPAPVLFAVVANGFLMMYFGLAWATGALTRHVLPALGIGHVLSEAPAEPRQLLHEIRKSVLAIYIFGGFGVLTTELYRRGYLAIDWEPRPARIALD